MPLRFFRKENSSPARREREEKIERALVDGFRQLSDLLKKAADLIEAKRLERGGYDKQEKFLERTVPPPAPVPPKDRR
ncbi:MAG: hypothetical protein Q8L48_26550 [Archangium sp.]|nr:hypothetical protein [Archangium sp.]